MKTKIIVYASVLVMLFSISAGVNTASAIFIDPSRFVSVGLDPVGTSSFDQIDHIVYRTDTALAYGFNPAATTPFDITFWLQGQLGSFSNNGIPVANEVTALTTYMTFTTKFTETVTQVLLNQIDSNGDDHTIASFASGEDTLALLNIYSNSTGVNTPNVNNVSGYTTGALTLTAHIFDQSASFDFNNDVGTGTGSFEVIFKLDSYDNTYWDLPIGLEYMRFYSTGTLNQPTLYNPTVMWDGTSTSITAFNPQLFRFDGSSDFYPVPEPSTFVLFAFGLAGLGFLARKKSKR